MLQLRFTNSAKPAMWLVAPKYSFGAQNDCDCVLAQAGVVPHHADIIVEGEAVSLVRIDGSAVIQVNGQTVAASQMLKPGDSILMGDAELAIADPKKEGPKKDFSDKTNLRVPLSLKSAHEGRSEALWHLRPLNTTLANSEGFDLFGAMLLGRSKECDICIPASHLSRKHAKFSVSDAGGLIVEDLGSSNGTFINGARTERISLHHGDEVSFDTLRFRVEAASNVEDVTTLRAALDETQIRQAVTPRHIERQKPSVSNRKAPPIRPKLNSSHSGSQDESSVGDTVKLLLGAGTVIGVVAWLAWFLLT